MTTPTSISSYRKSQSVVSLSAVPEKSEMKAAKKLCTVGASAMLLASMLLNPVPAFADEYGRETEAPTLFTGETVEICAKRGPLGKCVKTLTRTPENDNDIALKYFKEPTDLVKQKDQVARTAEETEGNALIQKLRQQSDDNREKNDLIVQQKTFMNDKSASFGPFDRQTLILNENGRGFTLLENPQAMRLKKQGLIVDKKFVRQPTQEELDVALEPDGPNLFESIFGGK
jgi:hypothetical protein